MTILLIIAILFALLLIGAFAGWLAVRHIRRLEPGILGRQSILVILGWSAGGIVAVLAAAAVMSLIQG